MVALRANDDLRGPRGARESVNVELAGIRALLRT